jgi:hypothetical protein
MIGIKVLCNKEKDSHVGGMSLATIVSEPFVTTPPDSMNENDCVYVTFDDDEGTRHRHFHLRRVANLMIA